MRKIAMLAGCLLLAGPALAQSTGEKTGINSLLGVSPTTPDFVKEAAMSDMFEIQSSQLAEQKGDAPTKSFAEHMITDHQKTTAALKSMVQSGSVKASLPTGLDSSYQDKLGKLQSESGKDFVALYASDQVSAHKDAVSLFQRYAKGGDNAGLKSWAGQTVPTLQQHLQMAEGLNKESVGKL
jgi:putative membrane protein